MDNQYLLNSEVLGTDKEYSSARNDIDDVVVFNKIDTGNNLLAPPLDSSSGIVQHNSPRLLKSNGIRYSKTSQNVSIS